MNKFMIRGSIASFLLMLTIFLNSKLSEEPYPPPYWVFFICVVMFAYIAICATETARPMDGKGGEKNPLEIILLLIPGMFILAAYMPLCLIGWLWSKITRRPL